MVGGWRDADQALERCEVGRSLLLHILSSLSGQVALHRATQTSASCIAGGDSSSSIGQARVLLQPNISPYSMETS